MKQLEVHPSGNQRGVCFDCRAQRIDYSPNSVSNSVGNPHSVCEIAREIINNRVTIAQAKENIKTTNLVIPAACPNNLG